ncbi:MAG: DNA replication and repair protein RecF [Gemmatimonadaceae bacterium]|nr:DNA replication and repair protein RecF [Gemmatimonadaceae bacterium]
MGARVELERIALRDLRNIARADLVIPPDGIAVVGDNGEGKTSLLEGIAFLHALRSFRGARDRDLVRFDAPASHITIDARGATARCVGVGIDRSGVKKISIDGVVTKRLTDALRAIPSVTVAPRDVALIEGGPGERRRFLDILLALTSPSYLGALRQYRAALARRNAALRDAVRRRGRYGDAAPWEPAMAQHGAAIVAQREAWARQWAPEFARLCARIGETSDAALAYDATVPTTGAIEGALREAFASQRETDARRGVTQTGPHRDDLALSLGGRPWRVVGSAGQARTAAIALRLLELHTMHEAHGALPVLLLDDPFAELDRARAEQVLALLSERGTAQVICCVPRADELPAEFTRLARWRVAGGVFTEDAVP